MVWVRNGFGAVASAYQCGIWHLVVQVLVKCIQCVQSKQIIKAHIQCILWFLALGCNCCPGGEISLTYSDINRPSSINRHPNSEIFFCHRLTTLRKMVPSRSLLTCSLVSRLCSSWPITRTASLFFPSLTWSRPHMVWRRHSLFWLTSAVMLLLFVLPTQIAKQFWVLKRHEERLCLCWRQWPAG